MMRWGHGMMGGWMGGWFGMLIPLILTVVIVYVVVRLLGHNHTANRRSYDNSLDILNERLARGEISEEEYERKKAMIMKR